MSNATRRYAAVWVSARTALVLGWTAFGLVGEARASTIGDINVVGWYGTGDKQTALVVDFSTGDDANDSFAFGWNYNDETITVHDLMVGIRADNSSGFNFFSSYDERYGYFIDAISYTAGMNTYYANYKRGDDDPEAYWYLWTSGNVGENWMYSTIGASQSLPIGEIAGWVAAVPDEYVYWSSSTTPVMPVPEPSTIILLLTGLAVLIWRWRRNRV